MMRSDSGENKEKGFGDEKQKRSGKRKRLEGKNKIEEGKEGMKK